MGHAPCCSSRARVEEALHATQCASCFPDLAYRRDEHGNVTYLPGSASYFGSVSLLDNTPVPEPATMTMFAFGLAAATLRRRRTPKCARH